MNKRYQVFVSSTFSDLKSERDDVMRTLMEIDCIPAGMELFPPTDDEQFGFIKKIIDDSDYYLVIVGGRYGSVDEGGVSYTEKEYEYAKSKGMKVIALLHGSPDDIPVGKTDRDAKLRERLDAFRANLQTGRLTRYWNAASELPGLVAIGIGHATKAHPATGWVRADTANTAANADMVRQLLSAREEIQRLTDALAKATEKSPPKVENLAGLGELFTLKGSYKIEMESYVWSYTATWGALFNLLAPSLIERPGPATVRELLGRFAFIATKMKGHSPKLDFQIFGTVSLQFEMLGLVTIDRSDSFSVVNINWNITEKGRQVMIDYRAVRSSTTDSSNPLDGIFVK